MKQQLLFLILIVFTFSIANGQQQLKSTASIPIIGFHGIPPKFSSKIHYSNFKNDGLSINLAVYDNADQVVTALDIAKLTGVKIIISTPELTSATEKTVRRFMNHPALYAYFLADEPNFSAFGGLSSAVKKIKVIDSKHPCYINLYPNYANGQQLGINTYESYVNEFIKNVPVPFISFDFYPLASEVVQPGWYSNLETIASATRKAGKPFWGFVQTTAFGPFKTPDIAGLRIQAYSNLAYGAQGIQYFTYWTLNDTYWIQNKFGNSIVDKDGGKIPLYERVKQMNREIKNLSPIFLGCIVKSVFHTGNQIPPGTKKLIAMPYHFKVLSTQGIGAVVSQISNGGKNYLVIVNRDFINKMKLTYQCDGAVKKVTKEGTLQAIPSSTTTINVDAGDAVVFAN